MGLPKALVVLLFLGCIAPGLCKQYKVFIMTGWRGTSSPVDIRLVGSKGRTSVHTITPSGGKFVAFSKNIFNFNDVDVGIVELVQLRPRSGRWFITKVLVVAGKVYIFDYNKEIRANIFKWTSIGAKCTKGFQTGPDGTCVDIDECTKPNACLSRLAKCVNTAGSFECICPSGYTSRFKTCYDIDECRAKPCHQSAYYCRNTPGSYECVCKSGQHLEEGKCVDIDECKLGTDSCDRTSTTCVNEPRSYRCICKSGFKSLDWKKCKLITCEAKQSDQVVKYKPARCLQDNANKIGDICERECAEGYVMTDQVFKQIQCDKDGYWRGHSGNICSGRQCPKLNKSNVNYEFSCHVRRYKEGTCEQSCHSGYRKAKGDSRLVCQIDGTWSGIPLECEKDWNVPTITCSHGIYVVLPPGNKTTSVGSKWKPPYTNYPNALTVSPPGAGAHYQFPVGITTLKWTVSNPDGKTDECEQRVTVTDKEAPKIKYCPAPYVYRAVYSKPPYKITYKLPEFSDNIGVVRVRKDPYSESFNRRNGHFQSFTAYDAAGNHATCSYYVVIGGNRCTLYPDDRGLPGFWNKYSSGDSYTTRVTARYCKAGFMPFGETFQTYYTCDKATGVWSPDKVEECVEYKLSNETAPCEAGYRKLKISSLFWCQHCRRGTYYKQDKCVPCPAGEFQDTRGQSTCKKCPQGTSSFEGDYMCRDLCPAGSFSKDGMEPFCTLCSEGQYQATPGQTSCSACPSNRYPNTKRGATSCQDSKPASPSQKDLLEISSVLKPDKWNHHNINNTFECHIKDNSFPLVSVQWQTINSHNVPDDFIGKPKITEIKNKDGKVTGARMHFDDITRHNERMNYVCVATNINGETHESVSVPFL